MPAVQDNMVVAFEYTLTVDGAIMDSSQGKPPLSYVHGRKQIIPGLERELAGLHAGDAKDVTVTPADGYGEPNPAATLTVPKTQLPPKLEPHVGAIIRGKDGQGHPVVATIKAIGQDDVTLDLNHPLAGKTLHFNIKVISVNPST